MGTLHWILGLVSVALFIYLVISMLKAEQLS